jgi:hypothetical protein
VQFGRLICIGVAPDFISQFDAPTTAIAALAFAVGPLVIALAIVRGLVERFIYLVRWIVNRAAPLHLMPGESQRVKRMSNVLGTIALGIWFLLPPLVVDKHVVRLTQTHIIEPRGDGACMTAAGAERGLCRPDLKAALRDWVDARRRVRAPTVFRSSWLRRKVAPAAPAFGCWRRCVCSTTKRTATSGEVFSPSAGFPAGAWGLQPTNACCAHAGAKTAHWIGRTRTAAKR